MKTKHIKRENQVNITTTVSDTEVFDTAKFELVTQAEINKVYKDMFIKHKEKVLNLVISRISLDSVITTVERSLSDAFNGSPIQLHNDEANTKISKAFDKALLIYAFETALETVVTDAETRRDFVLKYAEEHPSFIAPPKEKQAAGVVASRDPEKKVSDAITKMQQFIEDKTGLKDDSTSPYGRNDTPRRKADNPGDGKLKVNGKLQRKSNVRRTTRSKT